MNLISKSLLPFLAIIFVVSCSNSMDDTDAQQTVYFNQFIPCKQALITLQRQWKILLQNGMN